MEPQGCTRTLPLRSVLLGPERPRTYEDLSDTEKKRYDADVRATNIVLQGLPKDIYKLINHNIEAKAIWDNVKINEYYVRFHKLVNDMRNIRMTMPNIQLNSKFVNNMSPEWDRITPATNDQLAFVSTVQPHAQSSHVQSHQYPSSSTNPQSLQYPQFPETSQIDSGYTQTDEILDNLTKQMALLAQSFRATLPQTNNQLRTSSNTRNQATIQDGRVVVQNVQGRQNQNQSFLDEEELLFLAGEQGNTFDADVDNQPVQDLALNEDNIFQADECDAFDSDVDDEPTAQSIFMANLSSVGSANPQAGPSNASILSEVAIYEQRAKFELTEREQRMDDQMLIEVRAMKAVFENLEAEIYQNETDLQSGEIERKNLLITNENLVAELHACPKIIQSRGNMIHELKEKISRLTKKNSDTDPIFDLKALVSQNKDLTEISCPSLDLKNA
ncbi:hypothetical protein Tco_1538901 [Tanacetum coccineum]